MVTAVALSAQQQFISGDTTALNLLNLCSELISLCKCSTWKSSSERCDTDRERERELLVGQRRKGSCQALTSIANGLNFFLEMWQKKLQLPVQILVWQQTKKKSLLSQGKKNATQHITVLMYYFYFYFCTCASEQQRCSAPEGAYLNWREGSRWQISAIFVRACNLIEDLFR